MLRKVYVYTLGCSKNLTDSELFLNELTKGDFELSLLAEEADVIIVNTCGFIESAKEESIDVILEMAKYKKEKKGLLLVVAGCLSERYKDELIQELPEVDFWFGINAWQNIGSVLKTFFEKKNFIGKKSFLENAVPTFFKKNVSLQDNYSKYIKIADGCNNHCSYCTIPIIRGNYRSREIKFIVEETSNYLLEGVKEINLIAQDSTSYGIDLYAERKLILLLEALLALEGDFWLRLLYCYPKYLSADILKKMAEGDKFCQYIDIPLQHIDNELLYAMNRKDTEKDIRNLIEKIKNTLPDVSLRTTFIVGFPGETEKQFQKLYDFVEQTQFTNMGAFIYSAEEGTLAANLPNQVEKKVAEERYHALMALQSKQSETVNKKLIGRKLKLLVEKDANKEGQTFGRTYREALDVDGQVFVEDAYNVKAGMFIDVVIEDGYAYDLIAKMV